MKTLSRLFDIALVIGMYICFGALALFGFCGIIAIAFNL